MKTRLDQAIPLLPLRLELRWVRGVTQLVKHQYPEPDEDGRVLQSDLELTEKDLGNKDQVWIRWYPDELAVLNPPKTIDQYERDAFDRLLSTYQTQVEITGEMDNLLQCYDTLTDAIGSDAGEVDKAEQLLFAVNGLWPLAVEAEQRELCLRYNSDALQAILENNDASVKAGGDPPKVGVRRGWWIYDLENPVLREAWRDFANKVGPVRARYIATVLASGEIPGQKLEEDIEAHKLASREHPLRSALDESGITVALMPPEIRLYTIKGNVVKQVGSPIEVPNHKQLKVALTAGVRARWLEDFRAALYERMGVQIVEPSLVDQIRQADWLVALGVDESLKNAELFEEVLEGLRSRGNLALIPHHTPTNNIEGQSTGVVGRQTDWEAYLSSTLMKLPRGNAPRGATAAEPVAQDAKRLATVLGIDPWRFSEIPSAEIEQQAPAEAANALVWLLCAGDRTLWYDVLGLPLNDPLWEQVGEFLGQSVRARGHLPVFRAGKKPYGVLPTTVTEQWRAPGGQAACVGELQQKIWRMVEFLRSEFRFLAKRVPTLGKSDHSQAYNTLLDVLRRSTVSHRLDIRPLRAPFDYSDDPRYLMMSLVADQPAEGDGDDFNPLSYLAKLAAYDPLLPPHAVKIVNPGTFEIPDPLDNHSRVRTSLLHWLISGFVHSPDRDPNPDHLQKISDLVRPLVPCTVEQLELLFMEGIDLLCHRVDAWSAAFSAISLQHCTQDPHRGWPYGVYGWLEKPGQPTNLGNAPARFVQAPSLAQAATSALLTNASLNSGQADGSPLHINLDSARTRSALWYLASIRAGRDEGEVLGQAAERMIFDLSGPTAGLSHRDVYVLRDAYPLACQSASGPDVDLQGSVVPSVMDGVAFVEDLDRDSNFDGRYEELAAAVDGLRDAATDVAVSEMLSAHMQGNTFATAAWLDFLDGEALPPEPRFLSSQRSGKTLTTRFFLNVEVPDTGSPTDRRAAEAADPVLSELCCNLLPQFATETVKVRFRRSTPVSEAFIIDLSLGPDLGLTPLDLVTMDADSMLSRIRDVLVGRWKRLEGLPDGTIAALGPFPRWAAAADLPQCLEVIPLDPLGAQISTLVSAPGNLVAKSETLQRLVRRNQSGDGPLFFDPLGETRLSSFADAEGAGLVDWSATASALQDRAKRLIDWIKDLTGEESDLVTCCGKQQAVDELSGDPTSGLAAKLARFNLRGCLTVLPGPQAETDDARAKLIESATSRCELMAAQLKKRKDQAEKLLVQADSESRTKKKLELVARANRLLAGRPGLPVLTPLCATQDRSFKAKLGVERSFGEALFGALSKVRPAVADMINLFGEPSGFKVWCSQIQGGLDFVVSRLNEVKDQHQACLVLLDQITEFVPSAKETTALSLQYDAPAARAPNVVLIAVPPVIDENARWSENLLAEVLRSTLDWMQIRMVTAQDVIGDNVLGHYLPLLQNYGSKKKLPAPWASRPLQDLMFDRSYDYRLADEVDETEQYPPDQIAERRSRLNRR